ncbi:RusA family crossover junction endodeoxyribonuclease, partial [Sulfoacidibacillus thermotolerans]
MRLILPIPPTLNHAYLAFIEEASWKTLSWMRKNNWRMPPPNEKIILRVWIFWPDRRRRDTDNVLKLLLDALKGVAFVDDCMVLPRVMDFGVDYERPRIEIELSLKNDFEDFSEEVSRSLQHEIRCA